VLLSATHTHNGPGTLSRSWFWNLVTMDRFRPEILEGFVEKVGEAVDAAVASLAPARLLTVRFEAGGVQANRRLRPGDFDPRANLLVARGEDGVWRGGIVHLALHGTSLPTDDLAFSADVPGRIEAALEARFAAANPPGAPPATVLFVNGAEGDVIPSVPGAEAMQALADRVGDQAAFAMTRLRPVEPVWRLRHADLALGRAHVNVAGCLSPEQRPTFGSRLLGWLPLALPRLPQETRLSALRLGDLVMFSWPGEPTTALGRALDALHPGAWTLGLTNDHLSYFTAPAEYAEGGYEACATLYGAEAGLRIVERHRELLGDDPRSAEYAP
jgi:hypothetical protein